MHQARISTSAQKQIMAKNKSNENHVKQCPSGEVLLPTHASLPTIAPTCLMTRAANAQLKPLKRLARVAKRLIGVDFGPVGLVHAGLGAHHQGRQQVAAKTVNRAEQLPPKTHTTNGNKPVKR